MKLRKSRIAVLVLVLVGTAAAFYTLYRKSAPQPPQIPLEGVDPILAEKIEAAVQEVRRQPYSGPAWGALSLTLVANGFDRQAIPCLEQTQTLEPNEARWPFYHATTLLLFSRPREAIVKLREALAVARKVDDRAGIILLLAVTLVEDGQLEEAENSLRTLQKLEPDGSRVHYGLGLLAVARSDAAGAHEHLGKLLDHPSARQTASSLLAAVTRDNAKLAQSYRERAAQLPPDSAWPISFYGDVQRYRVGSERSIGQFYELKSAGRDQEALDFLSSFVAQTPTEDSCSALGIALVAMNRFEEAEPVLRQALGFNSRNAKTHLNLGVVYFERARERLRTRSSDGVVRASRAGARSGDRHSARSRAAAPASRSGAPLSRPHRRRTGLVAGSGTDRSGSGRRPSGSRGSTGRVWVDSRSARASRRCCPGCRSEGRSAAASARTLARQGQTAFLIDANRSGKPFRGA